MYGRGSARFETNNYYYRRCRGFEQYLIDCEWRSSIQFSLERNSNINPSAGIICQGISHGSSVCEENTTRLVNGSTETEGRVEICAYGTWVTMCDKSWDIQETHAVCKQLGYPSEGTFDE